MALKNIWQNTLNHRLIIPIVIATVMFSSFSIFSVIRHLNFSSHAFDLGIYTQVSFLYSQNLTPYSTLKFMPLLADHFEPILLLLSPIYKVFPSPITLLIIQSFFVTLSAIPIYNICMHETKSKKLSAIIMTSYLTSVGVVNAIKFDFHTATISLLPLSLILYTWYLKKWRLYWYAIFFAFLFKEDLTVFTAGLGIYQLLNKQKKVGIFTVFISAVAFVVIKLIIMPFIWRGGDQGYIASSILPLTSPIDLLILLFTRPKIFLDIYFNSPIKQQTFILVNQPFAFIALLSPLAWFTGIVALYLRFTSMLPHFWGTEFHYNANIMPFLAVSTILSIKKYRLPITPISVLLLIILLLTGLSPNSILWDSMQKRVNPAYQYKNETLSKIPQLESVSAQSPLTTHLANRQKIYLFPEVQDANFIVFDTELEAYPLKSKDIIAAINKYQTSKEWKTFTKNKSLIIFERVAKIRN